ncbi:GDP-mannose-dependent alpha-(1-6)-phosphatidylinositol monomannoside mannosyltransferase [Sporotomaculum syntrophicum]|uniref:GDP-mannose-dependent alpha-(1-6)-phosphatidylinositol monomannoside mannosyltransferase n=1 Tax=Sporotomaculum syntrophicum TaxID=182264 RepID=A0A9D2WRJ3_9FIRM|nr:glycosyltransferase [Sporotomaculum syntrophicum]KAF1086048.1 GDP-mannose-dependent alpha-(1-6)-phosphatidylinositol monomannoside mannosyltransferase [Sporotomaculum syntrophicum]
MKIALVHDWLTNYGGAERVIESFHSVFPAAPVYTIFYDQSRLPDSFKYMDIRTSFLQKIPFGRKKHQFFLQFMPLAVEQFNLSEYDLVLSSSSSCAKGIITGTGTCHICYCNTPMRYAWDFYHEYIGKKGLLMRSYIAWQMKQIRQWDRISADRVDYYIANSHHVAGRIKKHYRHDSNVIYPPVDTDFYHPNGDKRNFFLCGGRLVGYKRTDLAVAAFSRLQLPLWVIGDGEEYKNLKKIAGPCVKFLGKVNDSELRSLYQQCRAFIFPGEEDFGIMPVEAQACGRPVIAFGRGGALETVIDGQTGMFFTEQSVDSLMIAVNRFINSESNYIQETIADFAKRFGKARFELEINDFVTSKYNEYKSNL